MSTNSFDRFAELYEGALAEPIASRDAWLDGACAGDAALRAELASLLARHVEADAFFDTLADDLRTIDPHELVDTRPPGDLIGPYAIEAVLGRGGMGVVYTARDTRLGRRVAIKVLPPWLAHDPLARARLVAEARAASAIDHPNIGALFDVVESPSGEVALVLALYEGETLRDRLARGPLDDHDAIDVARQVASGLAAAHAHGIVHRDVKPGNILLARDGRVRILDFGIAATPEDGTGSGARRAGTVAYMAPEQIRGKGATPAADLWSLGVVLHEMTTGRLPFDGGDEAAITRAIEHDDPPPLISPLAPLVRRLLEKDPAARLTDGDTVSAELTDLAQPRPLHARVRRMALAALAVVSASALLAAGVWSGRSSTAVPALDVDRVAVLPFAVRGDAGLASLGHGVADLLSAALHGSAGLSTIDPGAIVPRGDSVQPDPATRARLAAAHDAGRFVTGEVVVTAGRVRVAASLHETLSPAEPLERFYVEGALDSLFALVDEVASRVLVTGRSGPQARLVRVASTTTTSLPAFRAYLDADRALGEGRFSDAVDGFRAAVELDSAYALAHYGLAVAAGWSYRADLSAAAADQALAHANRLPSTERRLLEAMAAWPEGRTDDAERIYRSVLAEHPANVDAWYNLGDLYFHMNGLRGRPMNEAREPFERLLDHVGYEHYETLVHLADLAARERRYDDYRALAARLDPRGELADLYGLQFRIITGSAAERAALDERLRAAAPETLRVIAGRLAAFTAHLEQAADVSRLLTDPSRPDDWRAVGHLMSAVFHAGLDQWADASFHLESAARLAPGPALLQHARLWSLPFAPDDVAALASLRERLEAWQPESMPREGHPLLAVHESDHVVLRLYLLSSLALRVGDRPEAVAHATRLTSLATTGAGNDASLARSLARELRARLAETPAETASILLELRGDTPSYARVATSSFHAGSSARWYLADALRAAGRTDEAAAWYGSFGAYIEEAAFHVHAQRRLDALAGR